MNLNQLYYFRKLAEIQHYTLAAKELYISQPSLSFAISSLEKELDTCLFEKNGRNISLTKYGAEFYSYVTSSLDELEKGIQNIKKKTCLQTGSIDIGYIPTLAGDFIPKAIKDYVTTFQTDTTFHLYHGMSLDIIEGIKNGKYDIGFCSKKENENALVFLPMLFQELVVVSQKHMNLRINRLFLYLKLSITHSSPIGILYQSVKPS